MANLLLCLSKGLAPSTPTLAHTNLASEHLSSNITIYSTLQGGSKKRKLSQDGGAPVSGTNGNSNGTTGGQQQGQNRLVHVKQEPGDVDERNTLFNYGVSCCRSIASAIDE